MENNSSSSSFNCNICLDSAKDAVVTFCGHLFCWPCLQPWLNSSRSNNKCPICRCEVTEEKVIPIYGTSRAAGHPLKAPPQPHTPSPKEQGRGVESPRPQANLHRGFSDHRHHGPQQRYEANRPLRLQSMAGWGVESSRPQPNLQRGFSDPRDRFLQRFQAHQDSLGTHTNGWLERDNLFIELRDSLRDLQRTLQRFQSLATELGRRTLPTSSR